MAEAAGFAVTTGRRPLACSMHLLSGMRDRRFWHSDPNALLADAARSLDAKQQLAIQIERDWRYVDRHLGEVLLEIVREIPDREARRRREDRRLIDWVGRLVAEIPEEDPYREQVLRRLRQIV